MVLWVITILTVVAVEFSFGMRTEVNITKNFKDELQLYASAQGGVQQAIAEMIFKNDTRLQQLRKTMKTDEIAPEKKEWVPYGRPYTVHFERGECELRIMSEAGKININTVSEMTLRKIIGNLGLEAEARERRPCDGSRSSLAPVSNKPSMAAVHYSMKRGIIVAVAFLALAVVVVCFVGPERYRRNQQITADKARILWAMRAYIYDREQKQVPVPPHVTLEELIRGGYLSREDVAGWDPKTKVPTVAHGLSPRRSTVRNQVSVVISNSP